MTKRMSSGSRAPRPGSERQRTRYVLIVMAVTTLLVLAVFYPVWGPLLMGLWPEVHGHLPAPHGGTVVSIGEGDHHYHAEVAVEKGGVLALYTLGADAAKAQEIDAQVLSAQVSPHGESGSASVDLMPSPQLGDEPGKTARFKGRIPNVYRGRPLTVAVANVDIDGRRFRLEFDAGAAPDENAVLADEEERRLFLTPGGKYTEADIEANGRMTVSTKFSNVKAEHDLSPAPGARVCPITQIKATSKFAWAVGGKSYEFCCPPCIDEFVKVAKEHPEQVKAPESYVKQR